MYPFRIEIRVGVLNIKIENILNFLYMEIFVFSQKIPVLNILTYNKTILNFLQILHIPHCTIDSYLIVSYKLNRFYHPPFTSGDKPYQPWSFNEPSTIYSLGVLHYLKLRFGPLQSAPGIPYILNKMGKHKWPREFMVGSVWGNNLWLGQY